MMCILERCEFEVDARQIRIAQHSHSWALPWRPRTARAFDSGISPCTRSRRSRCRRRGKTAGVPTNAGMIGMKPLTTTSACESRASNYDVKLTVLCSDDCWSCRRNNEIDLQSSELGGELGEALNASLRPAMRRRSADRSARPPRPQAADRCFFAKITSLMTRRAPAHCGRSRPAVRSGGSGL
jgi:hypothetical protein